ncbi:MAG TPA: hypothetical protein VEZ50_07460, partial [Nodosilinea sp.]|nr:hypothetical protein [Nodosilinea sp.]
MQGHERECAKSFSFVTFSFCAENYPNFSVTFCIEAEQALIPQFRIRCIRMLRPYRGLRGEATQYAKVLAKTGQWPSL